MPATDLSRTRPPRISAPREPGPQPPARFPVFAAFAPVLASLAMWAVTRSALALAFAALGPVIAIATTADSRLQQRRARRAQAAAFGAEVDRTREAIVRIHSGERDALDRRHPAAIELAGDLAHDPRRWRSHLGAEVLVRVGRGRVPSAIDYDDGSSGDDDPGVSALRELAGHIEDAPVLVDARLGIGFVGPLRLALSAARGVELQLATFLSPDASVLTLDETRDGRVVTHTALRSSRLEADDGARAVVAAAHSRDELPRGVAILITIDAAGAGELVSAPGRAQPAPLALEFVSLETATIAAAVLAECARREGVRSPGAGALPDVVALAGLPRDASAETLRCAIGIGERGPTWLDLVTDGPHAIVGGTTGSGKSELLLSWVIGMARDRGPDAVSFLFVDFKGGAAFDPLRPLRHCVGVITDLDPEESLRALSSLSAELRHRERELARMGLRSVAEAAVTPFPRLVVVVDEYAALVETHSALHALFADIASRGRSLGVHLVLCTQRPAGVVRDSILANCALRLSLRVTSAADSTAVIGTDAAAALPARPLGRAMLSVAGAPPELAQIARSTVDDIQSVVDRWGDAAMPRAPWLPPLAHHIAIDEVALEQPGETIPFAMVDLPSEQRQEVARYDPRAHGSLLVVGASGSGKTGVLAALAAAPGVGERQRVAGELPALWDALTCALHADSGPRLLLIDDVDAVVASCPDEYQVAIVELLGRVLREGPARGIHAVLAVQRISGGLNSIAVLCGTRLVLRSTDRQEHLLAGGEIGEFTPDLPAGGGHWRGHRIQVLDAPAVAPREHEPLGVVLDRAVVPTLAVVSTRPRQFADELRASFPTATVTVLGERTSGLGATAEVQVGRERAPDLFVADPDGWQAHWALLGELRREGGGVLFDGCTPGDIRALTRIRELPPPFARGRRPLWLLDSERDGELRRASLPTRSAEVQAGGEG